MKTGIIIGATSGIGLEVSRQLVQKGWKLGIAGRRVELLEKIQAELGKNNIEIGFIDIAAENSEDQLKKLIQSTEENFGKIDLIFNVSGIGSQNKDLKLDIELNTVKTNALGFTRMMDTAFQYFTEKGSGHIAAVSSIAGTKGLGAAPAYSATKRFQNTYLQCLAQLATIRNLDIKFTDIRPGFVDTDLLKTGTYPLLMKPTDVAKSIVKAIESKKRKLVIDWKYAIITFFWRLIPDCIWERLKITN